MPDPYNTLSFATALHPWGINPIWNKLLSKMEEHQIYDFLSPSSRDGYPDRHFMLLLRHCPWHLQECKTRTAEMATWLAPPVALCPSMLCFPDRLSSNLGSHSPGLCAHNPCLQLFFLSQLAQDGQCLTQQRSSHPIHGNNQDFSLCGWKTPTVSLLVSKFYNSNYFSLFSQPLTFTRAHSKMEDTSPRAMSRF